MFSGGYRRRRSDVFEHILHLFLVFLLLTFKFHSSPCLLLKKKIDYNSMIIRNLHKTVKLLYSGLPLQRTPPNIWYRPFGKLGIGISASALASASAFKYEYCLLQNISL